MKLCKIDEQGYFVEDVLLKEHPTIEESYSVEEDVTVVDEETQEETIVIQTVNKTRVVKDPLYRSEKSTGGLHLPRFNFQSLEWEEGRATLSYSKEGTNLDKLKKELDIPLDHRISESEGQFHIRFEGILQDVEGNFEQKIDVEADEFVPFDITEVKTLIDTTIANHVAIDLDKLKEEQVAKLKQDTYAYITNGFDTDVKYGEVRHYSLSEIDQMNINSMMGQLQSGKIQKALWSDDSQTSHDIWTLAEFEEFYIQANTFILQARLKSDIIEGKILRAYTEDGIKSHDFTDSLTNEELTEMQGLVNEMLGTTV